MNMDNYYVVVFSRYLAPYPPGGNQPGEVFSEVVFMTQDKALAKVVADATDRKTDENVQVFTIELNKLYANYATVGWKK